MLAMTSILGIAILASYATVLRPPPGVVDRSFVTSAYWLGLPPALVYTLVGFQVAAAIGFLAWAVSTTMDPPRVGILSYMGGWMTPVVTMMVLLASLAWPFLVRWYMYRRGGRVAAIMTTLSLVFAGIGAVLMVAGSFEDIPTTGWGILRIVGSLLFAMVVVLADAVGWNARFILHR